MSWRDVIQTIRYLINIIKRWDLAKWEVRLSNEEKKQEAERERLSRLDEIERSDAQNIRNRVTFRLSRVDCYLERQDLARLNLFLVLENWSIYDVVVDRVQGEIRDSNGPKIVDLSPKLDNVSIVHQSARFFAWDSQWNLPEHVLKVLEAGNRRFNIRVHPTAHFHVDDVGDFSVQADLDTNLEIPAKTSG